MIIAGVDVKNSNCVPTSSTSTTPDLTDSANRNGGRKTRNPEAAARLTPMKAAMATVKPSMLTGLISLILIRSNQSPNSTKTEPMSTLSP